MRLPVLPVARLQQMVTLGALVLALLTVGVLGDRAPIIALSLATLCLMPHAPVLALEMLLLRWVAARDPVPVATPAQCIRAWTREVVQGWRVFAWRQPFRSTTRPDWIAGEGLAGRRGVLLVHGFVCNRGFWLPWLVRLRGRGHPYVAVDLAPPFAPIDDLVPALDEAVTRLRAATGLPPLVVAHSMGGLVVRAWMRDRRHAGEDPGTLVHEVITIGSPHAGTWLARWSQAPNARQMRVGSRWLEDLRTDWAACERSGMAARYTCWYSNADNIVMPPSTACLPGADNRLLPGVAHVELAFQPAILEDALARLVPPLAAQTAVPRMARAGAPGP